MKHTPGPWICEETDEGHEIRMGAAVESPYAYDCHLVVNYNHECFYDTHYSKDKPFNQQALEAEANANLIAAAPELLEACKRAILFYRQHNTFSEDRQFIEAAILKAEGGNA